MEILAEWERELLKPFPPEPAKPAALYVAPRDLRPGMRIYNGYDPYMVVVSAETVPDDQYELTRVTLTVGRRTYTCTWENNDWTLLPVATPSIYN